MADIFIQIFDVKISTRTQSPFAYQPCTWSIS